MIGSRLFRRKESERRKLFNVGSGGASSGTSLLVPKKNEGGSKQQDGEEKT